MNVVTLLYNGPGQGRRYNQGEPLYGGARCEIGPTGQVTAWLFDYATSRSRQWRGTIFSSGWIHLWAPTLGLNSDTALGRARLDSTGALVIELAMAGAGLIPEQWRFTLAPANSFARDWARHSSPIPPEPSSVR